jgi:NAD(P)-dependent dehydrogenase (short-subunit alcohol dehydrogenase family)
MNILITGGSSGLGRCVVEMCASNSENKVYFTYGHKKEATAEIECKYTNVKGYQVDFTKDADVDLFASEVASLDIDILLNNAYAGNPQGTYFHKTDPNEYLDSFQMNIIPMIKITQACVKVMRRKMFGKIINTITSYVMDVPPMGFSMYAANKAYMLQLSKSWSKEYGRFNIASNCVLPDFMNTTFAHIEDIQLEQIISANPLKRLLQPEEVAEVIMYLMKTSQQVNGVAIPINAAQHIM